jgi:hypothetical protein
LKNVFFPLFANCAVFAKRPRFNLDLVIAGADCPLALFRVFETLRGTAEKLELFLSFWHGLGRVEVVARPRLKVLGIRSIFDTIMLSNFDFASSTIISWFLSSTARIFTCYLNFSRITLELNIPGCWFISLLVCDLN